MAEPDDLDNLLEPVVVTDEMADVGRAIIFNEMGLFPSAETMMQAFRAMYVAMPKPNELEGY